MTEWNLINDICEVAEPCVATPEKLALMTRACREMAFFHAEHCPEIRYLYKKHSFDPQMIQSYEDLALIPPLGVAAMKHFLMTSLPHEKTVLKLTSSGTKGLKTQIWFDEESLHRVQRMMDVFLEQEDFVSQEQTNYLIFNYDPEDAKDLGVAFSDMNQIRFAPCHKVHYTVKKREGEWLFDKEKALSVLSEYEKEGLPVRIFGMPAFIYDFIRYAEMWNKRFVLDPRSLIITGGGWKASEDKMITRDDFRRMTCDLFSLHEARFRDAYGMAEHSAPYFECREHRFHIAVYNKMIIRDPISLQVKPDGEVGLMELITPFNAMMPTLALLTTDWAKIDTEPCPCGYNTPTFTLFGRAGTSKFKGCAIHADDIVKRGGA